MLKVSEQDLDVLKQFERSFAADCQRCFNLRFCDPTYAIYNLKFLHKLGNTIEYTPVPPTQTIIASAVSEKDWITILKHCDITRHTVLNLAKMSGISPHSISAIISKYQILTSEFIRSNYEWIDWRSVSENERISVDVLLEHKNNIDWVSVSRQRRTICELLSIEHLVDWDVIVDTSDTFDAEFVRTFQWTIHFGKLSTKRLSAETILEFADSLEMSRVSINIPIDCIPFVDTVKDVIDWRVFIEVNEVFTYEFVATFYMYIDFEILSSKYLCVNILDHFANVINWTKIYRSRKYSPSIKKQFASRMWWDKLLQL